MIIRQEYILLLYLMQLQIISVLITVYLYKPVDYEVNSVQVCRGGERERKRLKERRDVM